MTLTARDLVGTDRPVRIKGGRTVYESVEFNEDNPHRRKVRLSRPARVKGEYDGVWREHWISRYINPDTEMEYADDG